MGNVFFNLGFAVLSFSGVWGNPFGTSFYDTYFLTIGGGLFIGLIASLIAAAAAGFIFPSGTKSVAYAQFTGIYWFLWGSSILLFTKFSSLVGDVGMQMIGMVLIIVIILFIVGITQCELGGFASHE